MLGIRDDNPSSVAIFLLASISFVRSSPDTSIGGLGGRGAGRKIYKPFRLIDYLQMFQLYLS